MKVKSIWWYIISFFYCAPYPPIDADYCLVCRQPVSLCLCDGEK
jgi:hypothetical protein